MVSDIKNSASKYKNLFAFFFFVILSIIAIGANPFAKETVGPFDLLVSYHGYSSVAPSNMKVRCRERSDILNARMPGLIKLKKEFYYCLENFHKKKLNLVGNLYVLIWKPSLFIFVCIPNDPLAFYCSQLFKLIIAAFGTYLFLQLFLSYPASLFGGIVYMLCGFNTAWLFWPQVDTSVWIPWVFWAVALYLISNRTKYLFLITLVTVFLIKGAFPAVAAYGLYSVALLIFIYNIFNQKNVHSFFLKNIIPLLFIAFAFIISSDYLLNLVNTLRNVDLSYRAGAHTILSLNKLSYLYKPRSDILLVESSVYCGFLAFIFSLISFPYLWTKKKSKESKSFYIFSLLLMIISIVIAYGLINHNLIQKIPIFSFNAWQRMSVIIGLSIALLSSFFIEWFQNLKEKPSKVFKLVIPFLIIVFLVQFVDQKKYFNKFNGATRSEYFYPMTPSIDFVKKNINDYQSIIADSSFGISGTLSSYNFFEWYSHSFKSIAEKKLLLSLTLNLEKSPTAFTISSRNIDFSSSLMDLFAIKYILINAKYISIDKEKLIPILTFPFYRQPEISHCPSPPIPFNEICQHFHLSKNRPLYGISLFLGNYRNNRFDSDVLLKLYDSKNHELIGISKKDKRYIKDNTWVYFDFGKVVKLEEGEYEFSLTLLNKKTHSMLSAWSTKRTSEVNSYLAVNGEETNLSFKYFLHEANDIYEKEYRIHRLERAVAVVENLKCPEGPYLISDIDKHPPVIKIRNLNYESTFGEIIIHLPEKCSGYVIIPRPNDNYLAYVDGKLKDIEQYLSVMPAVYVDNNTQIFIKEKPFYLMTGFIISFFSLLVFIIFLFFKRKSNSF